MVRNRNERCRSYHTEKFPATVPRQSEAWFFRYAAKSAIRYVVEKTPSLKKLTESFDSFAHGARYDCEVTLHDRTSQFLAAFREPNEAVHLRGFKPKKAPDSPENKPFTLDTTLRDLMASRELQRQLTSANETRGVYFAVNVGAGTDESTRRYTAFFCEADDRPIAEQHAALDAGPLQPSIRVETRNSVHAYWNISGNCSEPDWREVQGRLIAYFKSDPKIINPSRVMRLPGFDHLHLNGGPDLERKKVSVHTFEPERRYTTALMLEAFPARLKVVCLANTGPTYKYHEDRHEELCRRITARAKRNSKGNWDTQCLAHKGNGKTGLVHFPSSGAVKCNNDPACDYFAILRAEGLSEAHLPSREKPTPTPSSTSENDSEDKNEARSSGSAKKKDKLASASPFADPEPWPESVDGGELLDSVVDLIRRYVDAEEWIYHAVALWCVLSYCFDRFFILPILLLTSPTKRSGKSTLLQILAALVSRPFVASSISPAALFRGVEAYSPTLLVDEADTFLNESEDLRGLINSGHTKGTALVWRCTERGELQSFKTFCPKAIAMIGKPKDTIVDRSIVCEMKRARQTQTLELLRADRLMEIAAPVRSKLARFAIDNAHTLLAADPEVPSRITSARARDNWRPPLAIADLCGDAWSTKARSAALRLSNEVGDLDGESVAELLLADIKSIFDESGAQRIFSKILVEELIAMSDHPWGEINHGKSITERWLARKLRPFGILPNTLRLETGRAKGYELDRLTESFSRYLPRLGEFIRDTVTTRINIGENANFIRDNEKACHDYESLETRINIDLSRCHDSKGGTGSIIESQSEYVEPTKEEWTAAASNPDEWNRLVTAAERYAINHEGL